MKAYSACRALGSVTDCADDDLNGTIRAQSGTAIKASDGSLMNEACFNVYTDETAKAGDFSVLGTVEFAKSTFIPTIAPAAIQTAPVTAAAPTCT